MYILSNVAKHLVDIDETALAAAQAELGTATMKETVNEALRRLYGAPERFGLCEQCGEPIGFDRLDALPHARLCIKCKAKEEDGKRR